MWSFFSRDAAKDFAYDLGDEVEGLKEFSIWKFHSGKKKATGEPVSIFVFENTSQETQTLLEIAKAALKRLKTLRHPSILTYVDSLETEKLVYLVVEPVIPLELHLAQNSYTENQKTLAISWGLYQIATGLGFLNHDCHLSHNNICLSSVFVDKAGEWKLFGLEYVASDKEAYPVKVMPSLQIYNPPESGRSSSAPSAAADSWGLGCLVWEVFNSRLIKTASLKNTTKMPSSLCPLYCELVGANPESRPSPAAFLKRAKAFFRNKFVDTMLFLREIHIKENEEKLKFFNTLPSSLDSFPQDICLYRVLPELVNAFEFGNAGSSVLTPMFKLGKLLPEEEYQKKIVPCIVKMFSSKDRATRAKLLQQVEQFIDHIQPSIINNQIFPNIAQGFLDTNPTIRDQTIKCMLYLAPKLNYHNLNEEMLKHFARLQSKDEQGGIRTNTTVCLGKIASYLHPQTRKKVLINAFLRALRDPFPPARTAAILALSATEHYYSINDCATKVLPALCHFTVDPEKEIRDQAFKAIGGFLSKLQKVSEDPSLAQKMEEELQSTTPASIAATWTSWAVTSLTDKLYKSSAKPDIKSTSPSPELVAETSEERAEKVSESKTTEADSWNNDDWGNDDQEELSTKCAVTNDGWEEEWGTHSKDTERLKSYFPGESEDPFSQEKSPAAPNNGDWDTDNWDNWESNQTTKTVATESLQQRKEANRLAREERRKQKLKEKQLLKLGAQKISN